MTYGSAPMSISRVTTDGASSVCSVESTRWPVCAACIAIFAVSASRISPTQDDVGILAQDRAQRAGERQLDLLVDLRLVDAGDLILDRILDRDDVGLLRLHRRQRRAERRRLAAAGRADDENHAVLVAEELRAPPRAPRPTCRSPRAAARPCGGRARACTIFSPNSVRSVETRKSTSVPSSAVDAEAAVLRQPLLGDVHARHDLQARDQPFVDPLGQVHHFLEQAVEAVADEDALFHRLDVHVARLALDGALHDEIDEVDDRRRFAALLEARRPARRRRLRRAARARSRRRRFAGLAPRCAAARTPVTARSPPAAGVHASAPCRDSRSRSPRRCRRASRRPA